MRFEAIKVHGIGPYGADVDLDLSAIPGKLVAITGPNGAGKSTLLELLSGALFRQCPTRGSLASLAHERDAYVEARVANGHVYTVRQVVDAMTGKGETLILDAAGQPVTESGKVSDADAWIAAHFPPREVLHSSSVSVQGQRGFLDLKRSARMGVLLRVLRVEHLERLAEAARQRATELGRDLESARRRLQQTEEGLESIEAVDARLGRDRAAAVLARQEAESAVEALAIAREASKDAMRIREIVRRRRALDERIKRSETELQDVGERVQNNRNLLGRADEIRLAVEVVQHCEGEIAARKVTRQAALDAASKATADQRVHAGTVDAKRTQLAEAKLRQTRLEERLAGRAQVEEACATLAALEETERTAAAAVKDAERRKADHQDQRLTAADTRIGLLRGGINRAVTLLHKGLHDLAQPTLEGTIEGDDQVRFDVSEEREFEVDQALQVAQAQHESARAAVTTAAQLAARREQLDQAEQELAGLLERRALDEQYLADQQAACAASEALKALHAEEAARIGEEIALFEADLKQHGPTAKLLDRIEVAAARLQELERTVERCKQEIAAAGAERSELPNVGEGETVDLSALEQKAEVLALAVQCTTAQVGRAESALETTTEAHRQADAQRQEIHAQEREQADWRQLGQDLGRDGLQAYEIDAAVPELNAIANDLLHTCHGSRFTVEVRTDRESADGKSMRDALDVRVLDNRAGQVGDRLAETYSGGEVVIVGEALALALTVLACRRAGIERPTLIRDESGAALDAENGRAYVAMLRRAAEAVQADKVLYVSHTPELQDLADARIRISDGRVEVQT
jgi:exonuclease SbcC